jgi:hypothetical protein
MRFLNCSDDDRLPHPRRIETLTPCEEMCRAPVVSNMTHTGIRKMTRLLASSSLLALAVGASFAHAGPRAEWFASAVFNDSAASRQSLHYTPVSSKDGLTPVSAEVRPVPHADTAVQFRGAGSIRADIARYNEERSVPRPQGRQADDGRSSVNGNFRN